ncbi:hypothetical protein MLD38_019172 [Melastoma candidum]|uniref:Uncharacterized protein n=1 Tax=Melastoma candidum TaxID=119954 RepID=A0ACB9QVK5_9MYRT|nr:hypothetical protein MLD38_019172 [Melastoma candidum]
MNSPSRGDMAGQSQKWMILAATMWIQAFTGTNFDFSSYSSTLKSVLGISQVELNYLSVASDMGKAFGWCSGVSLLYFPVWVVMAMSAFIGLVGYGVQWLVIKQIISLPYVLVFVLCLLAGCSICWFNTVCYVLCIRNFPSSRAFALSLSISFNGVSAALYTLVANAINPSDDTLFLFLNSIVPLFVAGVALTPVLRNPPMQLLQPDTAQHDSRTFLLLNAVAVLTGLYLLLLNPLSHVVARARILLGGTIVLLLLPFCIPGIVWAREWAKQAGRSGIWSAFGVVEVDDLELHEELIGSELAWPNDAVTGNGRGISSRDGGGWCCFVMEKDLLTVLGEEHQVPLLVSRWDFWLYYVAYFCGGTIGLVYSNNLGQISQSLGFESKTSEFVALYSSCSFFGRLLSAAPDFLRDRLYFARTGWLAMALVPTPIAFLILVMSGSEMALRMGTALIGLSSGFIFTAAISITSELFGPNSAGINHNILITNIPIGSLLYGLLAALVYDSAVEGSVDSHQALGDTMVCMGRKCYRTTFVWWACISMIGVVSNFLLFLRTKPAYDRFERNRDQTQHT